VDNTNPYTLDDREAARFRGETIGFLFQEHALLPQLSVLENVLAPTLVDTLGRARAHLDRARQLLAQVGLEHRLTHRPAQLSGGERQRAALARALIRRPAVLLCDEPTGNLDPRTAEQVADLLVELYQSSGTTLAVVTHSETLASRFPRRCTLRDGRLFFA
jgi:lipoprotein-releasing system ATP-binding protein